MTLRRNSRFLDGNKIPTRVLLIPLAEEELVHQNIVTEDRDAQQFGHSSQLISPIDSIDKMPTLVHIEVAGNTLSYPFLAVDERPTQTIPAVSLVKSKLKTEVEASEAKSAGDEDNPSFIRSLSKNLSVYAIASFMVPLSGLILVPFLTRTLSKADYGALTVLTTAISLVAGITQLGLGSAFLRAYNYDYKTERDRINVASSVVVLLLLISTSAAIVIWGTAPWIAEMLFNKPSLYKAVKLAALLLFLQNLTLPGYVWLRAENRAVFYSAVSILNLFVNLGASLVLVGGVHLGIYGAFIATGCSYACSILCTLPFILMRIKFNLRVHINIVKNLLSFGLPLVPSFVSIWILQLSDRYLLSRLGSLAEAASYSVAYTLGGILGVVVLSPFLMAWPTAMYTIAKKDEASHIFQVVFRWYSLFLLFATGGLLLITRIGFSIMFPPSYHSATPVMPIVAVSIVFYSIYNMFTIGASIKRKSWLILIFTSLSALINIVANLFLIPLYGSMGAATSTLIAYAFLACITYIVNQRIYPLPFEIGTFSMALCLGIALYIVSNFLVPTQDIYRICLVYLCALAIYGGCLIGLGKLSAWRHK